MFLPNVFSDNMVLQRGISLPVWGWADTGQTVTVMLGDQKRSVVVPPGGRWQVRFDPIRPGPALTMTVSDGAETIKMENIAAGDVWLCSGQSNMAYPLNRATTGPEAIAKADMPDVRLLNVPRRIVGEPQVDVEATWKVCMSESAADFSAVGFFFGRVIHQSEKIPIGLMNASYGGTAVQTWIPRWVLDSDPRLRVDLDQYDFGRAHALRAAREAGQDVLAQPPVGPSGSKRHPSGAFNGMIAPFVPFAIRGTLFYQGEGDVWRAQWYYTLFTTLIASWRECWRQGNFPFLFVQLPNLDPSADAAGKSLKWAELRESQARALAMPNTGMAVTIDVGDPNDLHPTHKQPVGERLAKVALRQVYGQNMAAYGPTYQSHSIQGDTVQVRFNHVEKGLKTSDGQTARGFALASSNQQFVPAEARIKDDQIILRCEYVPNPVAVRYAREGNPPCNLYNSADLPAAPFRTDDWLRVSADAR